MDQQGSCPRGSGSGVSSGIFIGGDNSGAVATGNAHAVQVTYGSETGDPLDLVDRLLQRLEADAGVLQSEQAEDVIDDVRRLHTEVHSRKPSAESVHGLLSRLTRATSSTAVLLATVDKIKDLITVLLH